MEHRFTVFADYFQFQLLNDSVDDAALSTTWSEQAHRDMLVAAGRAIWIRTVRNMHVPVTVEIVETEPDDDFAGWDHVTEASLEVPSGRVVVFGNDYWPSSPRIAVVPGTYAVRIYYGGLDTLRNNDLDGDDHYRVAMWTDPTHRVPRALKPRAPGRS